MGALSVLLIAAGAILTFAVKAASDDVDLSTVGVILMIVGGIGLVASLIRGSWVGFRSTCERRVSADGRSVVFEASEGNLNFGKRYGAMRVVTHDLARDRSVDVSNAPR